ncbi:MAG: CoA ester lyase [Protaetiibacter sp.]
MASAAISYLFVPASRPERYAKALAAGADGVIVDLEDAVAADEKDVSRHHLVAALEAGLDGSVHVRLNAPGSPWFEEDLEALAALSTRARRQLAGAVVPKAEDPEALRRVREVLGDDLELIALIESAEGVDRLRELSRTARVTRFAVGAADLSFDLDAEIASATIDHVYARLVIESRRAGLPGPIASPPFSITDLDAIEADARRLRGLGVTAQLCIHPAQIAAVHAGFRPSEQQHAWAQRVLASGDGAVQVDGQMVDKPIRERAARIIAQAERARSD